MTDRSEYLFEPQALSAVLAVFPHLRAALGEPAEIGETSCAFPDARKSPRQIVRVLAAAGHNPRLRSLAASIDHSVASGFAQPGLLKTSSRRDFVSHLSEQRTAEHLLGRGFDIEGLDDCKGSERVPELVARRDDLEVAVEVYTPRAWEGLGLLEEEVRDALLWFDLAWDYDFEVDFALLSRFDREGHLLFADARELGRRLDTEERRRIVGRLLETCAAHIDASDGGSIELAEPELNLRVGVYLRGLRPSGTRLPNRRGSLSYLTRTGHSPEWMFEQLVARGVRRKLFKGQASRSGLASSAVLIVDLAESEVVAELEHGHYRTTFLEEVSDAFDRTGLQGHEIVAYCDSRTPARGLMPHFLAQADSRSPALAEALFDAGVST